MRVKHQQLIVTKILEMLIEMTDRNHLLSSKDITDLLGRRYGYFIERKTLYHYMAELNKFYDIRTRLIRNTNYYYYNGKERLTSPELTIVLDAIDSLNFLSQKDSEIIKEKIRITTKVASSELPDVKGIEINLSKDEESEILTNVGLVNKAIQDKKMITFHYFDYDINKKRHYRDHDKVYKVVPIDTIIRDNKYYLVCLTLHHEDSYTIYRLDKMDMVKVSPTGFEANELVENFNTTEFSNQVFLMHNGAVKKYRLKVKNLSYMPNIIFDNLGSNIEVVEENEEYFVIDTVVRESSKFISWLEGYEIEILSVEDK